MSPPTPLRRPPSRRDPSALHEGGDPLAKGCAHCTNPRPPWSTPTPRPVAPDLRAVPSKTMAIMIQCACLAFALAYACGNSVCDDGDILVVGVTDPSGIVVADEAEPVDVYAAALQLATKMEEIAVQRYRRVIPVTSSAVCADGVQGSSSRLARPLKRLATIRSAAVSTPPRAASEQACSQMFHLGFGARFTMPVESSWTDASTPRRT